MDKKTNELFLGIRVNLTEIPSNIADEKEKEEFFEKVISRIRLRINQYVYTSFVESSSLVGLFTTDNFKKGLNTWIYFEVFGLNKYLRVRNSPYDVHATEKNISHAIASALKEMFPTNEKVLYSFLNEVEISEV